MTNPLAEPVKRILTSLEAQGQADVVNPLEVAILLRTLLYQTETLQRIIEELNRRPAPKFNVTMTPVAHEHHYIIPDTRHTEPASCKVITYFSQPSELPRCQHVKTVPLYTLETQ